jgi:hypothetical protein
MFRRSCETWDSSANYLEGVRHPFRAGEKDGDFVRLSCSHLQSRRYRERRPKSQRDARKQPRASALGMLKTKVTPHKGGIVKAKQPANDVVCCPLQ